MAIIKTDNEHLIFVGDIHGVEVLKTITYNLHSKGVNNTNVIVCGDIGFGFNKKGFYDNVYSDMEKRLKESNIEFYLIRGNHDDPSYFNGKDKYDKEHMHCVSDYDVISTPTHNILCVGGAVSVDRKARTKGKSWWEDEQFILDVDRLDDATSTQIDIVATHTAPAFVPPFGNKGILMGWSKVDANIIDDCEKERKDMERLYDALKERDLNISHWFYGHFHGHYIINVDGGSFIGLDICEIVNRRSEVHNELRF